MKYTTETFISKAILTHGNKYDYSKLEYLGINTKVCIICHEHGEFWQRSSAHLSGQGCPICSHKRPRISTEIFIEKANKIWNNKFDYSKTEYISYNKKVVIICPKHGEFLQTPAHHLHGEQCPKCAEIEKLEKRRDKLEKDFLKLAKIKFPQFDYSKTKYITKKTRVEIICPHHGSFWITPDSFLISKFGCQKCAKNHKYNLEEWKLKASKFHDNKYIYDEILEYKNAHQMMTIICPKHGVFIQEANSHLQGCGCPKCLWRKEQFKLWQSIQNDLNVKLEFDYKPNWSGRQHFDIYSIEYNFAIEYNGAQHYEPIEYFGGKKSFDHRCELDLKKQKLCKENNCKLWIIKYDYTSEDYEILIKEILNYING